MIKAKETQTQFVTFEIVADLSDEVGRKLAEEIVRRTNDSELCNPITIADGLNKRYLVAAGSFSGKGISTSLCDNEQRLIAAFLMVNTRMDETGSQTTMWMFAPDACAVMLEKAVAKCNQKKGVRSERAAK